MIKLNAGFSRKVGEPNYGSRGASVNVELEVESSLVGDPDGLMARIRNLFDIARQSVDAELANGSSNVDGGAATGGSGGLTDLVESFDHAETGDVPLDDCTLPIPST